MFRIKYRFLKIAACALTLGLFACSSPTVSASNDADDFNGHSSSTIAKSSSSAAESSSSVFSEEDFLRQIKSAVTESGKYTTRDSVAAYLCKFDKLPSNYVGKNEGKILYETAGYTFTKWNFNPWEVLGVMIGGDEFLNYASDPDYYHPTLPEGDYKEADVNYSASERNRGTKRLIYTSGCVIYYTADHYSTFSKMQF